MDISKLVRVGPGGLAPCAVCGKVRETAVIVPDLGGVGGLAAMLAPMIQPVNLCKTCIDTGYKAIRGAVGA